MGLTVTTPTTRPNGRPTGLPSGRVVRPSGWERDVRDRIIAGDDTALTEVYDQFASFVYGLALRVIGDPRAAEDVSQDVFVGIWQRPEAFDPKRGSLRTWLGTLTHRRAVDYVRREEARRRRTEREASRAVAVRQTDRRPFYTAPSSAPAGRSATNAAKGDRAS